jgi:UDP-N-acetyl-D-mannosaminuronic acid dehydrogenase
MEKKMLTKYSEMLLSGTAKLGIWGIGYLGYSDLAKYIANGIRCVVSDYSPQRLQRLQSEFLPSDILLGYLGHLPKNLDISKCIEVRNNYRELIDPDILVHILSVPTQSESTPSNKWVMEALRIFVGIKGLSQMISPLLIIESSLIPGTLDRFILPFLKENGLIPGDNILVGICSRTDWFDENGRLFDAPRIVSAVNSNAIDIVAEIMEIIGADVIRASDYRVVELVKSVENSYSQMGITMANQMALAFPDLDIQETLRLAAMRSKIPFFQPSFGSGGYDMPSACQYVMEGANAPEYLSIFRETNYADLSMPKMIADVVLHSKIERVGVLGISYKSNIKVAAMSPALRIIDYLKGNVSKIMCYDPFFSEEEIREITGLDSFAFPDGLSDFDAVVITVGHRDFKRISWSRLKEKLKNCSLILDNMGIWKDKQWAETKVSYRQVGTPGWNR